MRGVQRHESFQLHFTCWEKPGQLLRLHGFRPTQSTVGKFLFEKYFSIKNNLDF
jgi:hypothetical protein